VISENCHFPEVRDAGAGEVVRLGVAAFTAALERVLADDAARVRMGRAGRDLAMSRFTWPAIARQSVELYSAYGARQGWQAEVAAQSG
jgi:glycosyltransferase involved in cell wall biosynthesis